LETNRPLIGRELATIVFDMPALLADEAKQRADEMLTDVRVALGEERWPIVQVRLNKPGGIIRSQDLSSILSQSKQYLSLWVGTDNQGALVMGYEVQGAIATMGHRPLSMFLPEDDPNRTEGADDFGRGFLSNALRERALKWLQEQAITRLEGK